MRKYLKVIIILLLIFLSSSCNKSRQSSGLEDNLRPVFSEPVENVEGLKDKKGELYMLVEGAVDTWFFYHLHDYRSYEPMIRSTDYNLEEDNYIHKCRYRASTLEGGYETDEKIFKVILDVDYTGLKDFHVEDITGYKNQTEKE